MLKNLNLQRYLREYGDIFSSDGDILFCKVCSVKVNAEKKNYGHTAFENK